MIDALKDKTIGILCGGSSQEREVSLRSGKNVFSSLKKQGYKCIMVDPQNHDHFNGLFDMAFIALHGADGEDGTIQALLEACHIPYTGCGVYSSLVGMDKYLTKLICLANRIPVPKFKRYSGCLKKLDNGFHYPVILKPIKEGSSVDVIYIESDADLSEKTHYLSEKYGSFLLETFIDGKEVTVGIIDAPSPTVLPILELKPENLFYDYEAKYTKGMTKFIFPATLSNHHKQAIEAMALSLYTICKCSGMARIDLRVCPKQGPFILEVNTVPGLTDLSDLPAQAAQIDLSFDDLMHIILLSGVKRLNGVS